MSDDPELDLTDRSDETRVADRTVITMDCVEGPSAQERSGMILSLSRFLPRRLARLTSLSNCLV